MSSHYRQLGTEPGGSAVPHEATAEGPGRRPSMRRTPKGAPFFSLSEHQPWRLVARARHPTALWLAPARPPLNTASSQVSRPGMDELTGGIHDGLDVIWGGE